MSGISLTTASGAVTTPPKAQALAFAPLDTGKDTKADQKVHAAPLAPQPEAKPDAQLRERLRAIAETFGGNTDLVIRVDAESKKYIYEFRDSTSGEVLRRYPEADLAAILQQKKAAGSGLFVSTRA